MPKRRVLTCITLLALLTLTVITVAVSYIDFGAGNIVVAVTVATIKAFLVGLIFMHLLHDKPINAIIFCAAFLFLSLLFLFTFLDENSRNPIVTSNPPAGSIAAAEHGGGDGDRRQTHRYRSEETHASTLVCAGLRKRSVPAAAPATPGPGATAQSQEPPKK